MRLFSYANSTTMLNMLLSFDLDNFHNRHFVNLNLSYRPKDRYSFEEFAISRREKVGVDEKRFSEMKMKLNENWKHVIFLKVNFMQIIAKMANGMWWAGFMKNEKKFFFLSTCWLFCWSLKETSIFFVRNLKILTILKFLKNLWNCV
jgi:hypothetical protein